MSAPEVHVLPDLNSGPRAFTTTSDDHGGIALMICTMMATWVVLCFLIRVFMRATVSGPFGIDDWVCSIATCFGVIQMITSAVAVSYGFGKKVEILTEAQIVAASKAVYAAQLLYIVTNALTKCTVSLLLARIVFIKRRVYSCYAVLIISILWGIGSFIAEAVRCTEALPWQTVGSQCHNLYQAWQVITAFNILIEIMLLGVPVWLVWGLKTDSMRKFIVVAVFWLRSPVIVAAGIRLHFLNQTIGSGEPLFRGVIPFSLLNIEMHYGLMASTFPTLKVFIGAFNTGWGTGYGEGTGPRTSYAMHSLERNKSRSKGSTPRGGTQCSNVEKEAMENRDRFGKNVTHVRSTAGERSRTRTVSGDSSGSQLMIIHQTVTAEVHYESDEAGDSRDFLPSRGNDTHGKETKQ